MSLIYYGEILQTFDENINFFYKMIIQFMIQILHKLAVFWEKISAKVYHNIDPWSSIAQAQMQRLACLERHAPQAKERLVIPYPMCNKNVRKYFK
jgi:hypothetical protein